MKELVRIYCRKSKGFLFRLNNIMSTLEQLPEDIRKDVRILGNILSWKYKYSRMEDREVAIDLLKEHIADIVITILLKEDKERSEHFLANK